MGGKELTVKPANMADVASAYYSTGIGNIACFMSDVSSMKQLKSVLTHAKGQPIGPNAAENEMGKAFLSATIHNATKEGTERVSGRLECPAPYKVTVLAVAHILERLSQGSVPPPGFHTPTTAYGDEFLK